MKQGDYTKMILRQKAQFVIDNLKKGIKDYNRTGYTTELFCAAYEAQGILEAILNNILKEDKC